MKNKIAYNSPKIEIINIETEEGIMALSAGGQEDPGIKSAPAKRSFWPSDNEE